MLLGNVAFNGQDETQDPRLNLNYPDRNVLAIFNGKAKYPSNNRLARLPSNIAQTVHSGLF